jgi:hypothetical protein
MRFWQTVEFAGLFFSVLQADVYRAGLFLRFGPIDLKGVCLAIFVFVYEQIGINLTQ